MNALTRSDDVQHIINILGKIILDVLDKEEEKEQINYEED